MKSSADVIACATREAVEHGMMRWTNQCTNSPRFSQHQEWCNTIILETRFVVYYRLALLVDRQTERRRSTTRWKTFSWKRRASYSAEAAAAVGVEFVVKVPLLLNGRGERLKERGSWTLPTERNSRQEESIRSIGLSHLLPVRF